MAKGKDQRGWTGLDDVDYEDETEGANPMPDDDGNIVLHRKEGADERGRDNKKSGAARKTPSRSPRANARKATRPRK